MQKRIKKGVFEPRDNQSHLITLNDIADARDWTKTLSKSGRALDGKRVVTVPPKLARLFFQ